MNVKSLFDLTGEIGIVTGGAQGLGEQMALALAEAGANIVLADINLDKAHEVKGKIENIGKKCIITKTDVSNSEQIEEMVTIAKEKFGKIDILINNAGIVSNYPAEELPEEEWDKLIRINLTGVFLCTQIVGKEMIKQKKGSIINISSMSGLIVNRPQSQLHYNTSKSGVIMLTKSFAAEWAKYNIRVNAIAPGYMKTPLVNELYPRYGKEWIKYIPMGRIGEPSEIKGPALFLASRASSYMTGAVIVMDGGYTVW